MNTTNDFGRRPRDHATYALGNPEAAVRLARTSSSVACDIETGSAMSEQRWSVKAFSISNSVEAHVLDPSVPSHATAIRDCLAAATRLVFHNASYDVPILCAAGLMRRDDIGKVTDTLVTARLAWPDFTTHSNRLGDVASRVLGGEYARWKGSLEAGWKAVTGKSKTAMFDQLGVGSDAYVAYAAFDTIVTARVDEMLMAALTVELNPGLPGFRVSDAIYLNDREQSVNRLLLRRSATGIGFDDEAADSVVDELRGKASLHRQALTDAGVDPDAPASGIARESVMLLDEQGKLPCSWPRLKNGTPTTSKTWMAKLDHPLVEHAAALTQAERFSSVYSAGAAFLARDGVIRPQVNVLAAVTGRMSYGQPALQQFPGEVRRMFAFDRPVTSFDWSSIEPVVAANLAGDAGVLGLFEGGGDIYQPIADAAGITRKTAKTVFLAQLYGQGVASLALRLDLSEERAGDLVRRVRAAMPGISRMLGQVRAYGERLGAVQTISGRKIPLPLDFRTGGARFMGHKGVNYLIQGSAYDLLAEAIYAMDRAGIGDALCRAGHDELVVHTEVADVVERIMLTPPPAFVEASGRTPVLRVGRVDLGDHWTQKGA